VLDEKIGIRLEEHLERRERPPAPPGPRERFEFSFVKAPRVDYDHVPSGKLALRIEGTTGEGYRRTWSDGQKPLESQLNKFVTGLIRAAQAIKDHRRQLELRQQKHQEEERRRQQEEQQREALNQRCREETARATNLARSIASWEEAGRVRAFASAARQSAESRGEPVAAGSELERWLEWLLQRADRIDPLTTEYAERRWPPLQEATVTMKEEGPYPWSGTREFKVPVVPPPAPQASAEATPPNEELP
jgi:hypothetical protein